ncbi:MBL fold metallo-hydrolase [Actinophytocola gossypii]|uniref:MBL fold metallo-hydrolase n=1 Tax=Actinophytocola gossypii TaxID=2812003 RepID=A0ABT2JG79_9PSEU|nr:MBL fold metallo-hydrolase [Actinophytocola gossypii]MCT2586858.1 MBL fold metallo-hydrolase [Actinophytocola gossypii]
MSWIAVADGVFARRYEHLDQTLGVVVGSSGCLVIDSGPDETHGAELAAEVRQITPLPWTLVITHAHFDHFFGTAPFLPCPVWAHTRCRDAIANSDPDRRAWIARYEADGDPDRARRLADARLVLPTHVFTDHTRVDLGDRHADLIHPGRAHTDHDVLVHVPDAAVVFAGDLVEQGAPPSVGPDAHPIEWRTALDRLLALGPTVIVPGHGDPVDSAFVRTQQATLAR